MAYNDFIKFATNHRNLLETAIKKYPTAFKPSDLVEFDQVILESKKELRKEGLLEEWMPSVTFNCPEDYLYANAEEIFLESYLGSNYQNILIEQISGEIPVADINAAMKSQIEALKNLADWYFKLPQEQRIKLDRETVDSTKNRKTFMEELKDLESEINGIYGKLEKPKSALGKMANWAKQKISGRLQRGVGAAFGAGEVTKTALEEQKMFEELFGNDQVNEQLGSAMAQVGNAALSGIKQIPRAIRHVSKFKKAANAAQIAHQQAAQTAAAAAKTGGAAASGAGTAGTGTAAATGTQTAGAGAKGAAIAGKGAFAKLAAFAGAHPIGIAAGIGALVAAGAAGIKMRNRRKRIETLQAVARNAGAGGSVVTPPVESAAEKVAPPTGGKPTGGTPTGGTPTGGATTGGATTGGTPTGGATTGGTPTGGATTGGATTGGATTGEAKKEVPVEKTADKKDIHIYSGSKGKGFQSRVAQKINLDPALKTKAGESQKAAAKVMRGLAADLKQANFNVLEEKRSRAPERKEIGFSQTLAALDAVEDNTLRELLRIELLKTLRDEGLKVTSDSLRPGSSDRVTAVVDNANTEVEKIENNESNKIVNVIALPSDNKKKNSATENNNKTANSDKSISPTANNAVTKSTKPDDSKINDALNLINAKREEKPNEIKRKWNSAISKAHPDHGGTVEDAAKVNAAKETLQAAELMNEIKLQYTLGLITLREYNIQKQKLDSLILREEIKRQVRSIIKK